MRPHSVAHPVLTATYLKVEMVSLGRELFRFIGRGEYGREFPPSDLKQLEYTTL